MAEIASGTEQNDWDLAASEQLEVDVANDTFTLTVTGVTKVEVQLGNAANTLHASGGIVAVTIKVTEIDTGDKCLMQQKQVNVVAGTSFVKVSCDPFWAKVGSIIEVHAKSSNANDTSVGGKVWLVDVTPSDSTSEAIIAALMAHTGFTVGGTMSYETLMKLLAAWVAGTWQDKSGSSVIKELLDADDNATVVIEQTLSATTPYRIGDVQ